jgi:hypothetical protein
MRKQSPFWVAASVVVSTVAMAQDKPPIVSCPKPTHRMPAVHPNPKQRETVPPSMYEYFQGAVTYLPVQQSTKVEFLIA